MKKIAVYIILVLCFLSCTNAKHANPVAVKTDKTSYHLVHIGTSEIIVDGVLDKTWRQAITLTNLSAPWNENFELQTQFRAVHTDTALYFYFSVQDDDIFLEQSFENEESNAVRSDRVELFLRHPTNLNPYYSFEMDASGRLFDSKGVFNGSIDESWNIDRELLRFETKLSETGYLVEGVIKKSILKELGLISEKGTIAVGVYRGNYHSDSSEIEWISWIKPESEKPKFHIPSSFGTFIFDE